MEAAIKTSGRLYETNPVKRWWAEKYPILLAWLTKYVCGLEDEPNPDPITKKDILGTWKGTDSLNGKLSFTFLEDDTYIVERIPSARKGPSTGAIRLRAQRCPEYHQIPKAHFLPNDSGRRLVVSGNFLGTVLILHSRKRIKEFRGHPGGNLWDVRQILTPEK